MWLDDLAQGILRTWNDFLENIYVLITMSPVDWQAGEHTSPWGLAENIHGSSVLMNVAFSLMVIFWAISFFRHVENLHRIDMREMLGWILRLALVYAILQVSLDIMRAIMEIGLQINAGILDVTAQNSVLGIELPSELQQGFAAAEASMDQGTIFEKIGAFFSQLLPSLMLLIVYVVVFACGIIIVLTLFLRFAKMYIYTAIAPIPLATFAGSATEEVGRHFLKVWFAVCLEICIVSIAIGVFNASISATGGLLPVFETTLNAVPSPDELFYPTMKWAGSFLIKIILLTTLVKNSDQIASRIVGV